MGTAIKGIGEKELKQLDQDMALIEDVLLTEEALSDCARKELAEARKVPDSKLLSSEEVK